MCRLYFCVWLTVNNIVNGIAFSKINLSRLKEVQDVEGLGELEAMLDDVLVQREGKYY
ncbi:Hypothetical protein BHO_0026401 (plasmid) [Borrelia hermsii YBT]|nr:Hypothetical protein BHO_0026401 [Borrelia hermsii YBT]